jgi:hypothetical protein
MMNNHKKNATYIASAVAAVAAASGLMFKIKRRPVAIASHPGQLSTNDWKQIGSEIKHALGNKNLPIFAAGVAFFCKLWFFSLNCRAGSASPCDWKPRKLLTRGYGEACCDSSAKFFK